MSLNGGPSGDLYVDVTVKKHEIFEREGNHLICTIPISFGKAVLGGVVEAPTIDGAVNLTIPEETQSGKTLCMFLLLVIGHLACRRRPQ